MCCDQFQAIMFPPFCSVSGFSLHSVRGTLKRWSSRTLSRVALIDNKYSIHKPNVVDPKKVNGPKLGQGCEMAWQNLIDMSLTPQIFRICRLVTSNLSIFVTSQHFEDGQRSGHTSKWRRKKTEAVILPMSAVVIPPSQRSRADTFSPRTHFCPPL